MKLILILLSSFISFCLVISRRNFQSSESKDKNGCASEGCQAYPCYENTAHCGNKGYLIAFGEKYCRRFISPEIYDSFDESGKKFINCTGKCLIDSMDEYIKDHSPSSSTYCDNLSRNAFDSHVKCYLDCDFCKVCKTNKLALFHTYDIRDFFSQQALKQVWQMIQQCGFFGCFQNSNFNSLLNSLYRRYSFLENMFYNFFA